jgi:hypothetical protein
MVVLSKVSPIFLSCGELRVAPKNEQGKISVVTLP